MYQALYRKWRPRTFDDVVGQEHITETLKRQVSSGRLSHAYLFIGSRGTGKTTCAKILAKAVNCLHPVDGNPCNECENCRGIDDGSILDVLELDAASNNGVEHVRAIRDEAVYSPAKAKKRVYIIDEVHMLSLSAFNALLKILEEPPDHLMFILATTESNKVLTTIKSRCQQYAFKRILTSDIEKRLGYVAMEENINLDTAGARLLARLADGGMRDALSLLDQCSGRGDVNEKVILETLGLAGNTETAKLMEHIVRHETGEALQLFGRLYQDGKDAGALMGELASLARDLLLAKTAPGSGDSLMTGGFEQSVMKTLGDLLTGPRLLQMLTVLQQAQADIARSSSRRTDGEMCIIRLSDEKLDESVTGLSARIAALEQQMSMALSAAAGAQAALAAAPAQMPPVQQTAPAGTPVQPRSPVQAAGRPQYQAPPAPSQQTAPAPAPQAETTRPDRMPDQPGGPWDEEPPMPEEPPAFDEPDYDAPWTPPQQTRQPPVEQTAPAEQRPPADSRSQPPRNPDSSSGGSPQHAPPASRPAPPPVQKPVPAQQKTPVQRPPQSTAGQTEPANSAFWQPFLESIKSKIPPWVWPHISNPRKVAGVWRNGTLTLWVNDVLTRSIVNKPGVLEILAEGLAKTFRNSDPKVQVVTGAPPKEPVPLQRVTAQAAPVQTAQPVPDEENEAQGDTPEEPDMMDELLAFGQYDNIVIE